MKPTTHANSSRRQFVRTFALGTGGSVIGTPWVGTLVATLLTENRAQAASDGQLNLHLTNFPSLLDPFGSVRVSVTALSGSYPSPNLYPPIISRGAGNTFFAVSSNCTHRGCVVMPFDGNVFS